MDWNNWSSAQLEAQPPMDGGDWRSQLQPESRQRIVNKIMETLKRHVPFCGQEGLQELKQVAIRFEENTYSAATSQSDYLRKISIKMLTMEAKSQNTLPNALPSNAAGVSRNPRNSAFLKATNEQFETSDKALANTLIMKFSNLKLTSNRGVGEHIMKMTDIATQLKTLEVDMSESFLVHFILNTLPPSYGPFKISYITHNKEWSINELMTLCVQEEGRLLIEQGESSQSAYLATQEKAKTQTKGI